MFLHVLFAKKHNCFKHRTTNQNTFFRKKDCECALVPFENEVTGCYVFTDAKSFNPHNIMFHLKMMPWSCNVSVSVSLGNGLAGRCRYKWTEVPPFLNLRKH